jgi:hypothetical protein
MADKAIHARLVVHDYPSMTKKERRDFVSWLRKQLSYFENDDPSAYAEKYTARLFK